MSWDISVTKDTGYSLDDERPI